MRSHPSPLSREAPPPPALGRGLKPADSSASPQGHGAPQLRSRWHFSHFGEAAFLPFPPFFPRQASCSLLSKHKHPKLFADANSRLPAELCLISLRVLRFLLGTFRYSSAVFFLPRRDPGEVVCSCLMAIQFAATSSSSCAITLFLVTDGTARARGLLLSEANILNYCKLSFCSCTQPCSLPALVPSWHGMARSLPQAGMCSRCRGAMSPSATSWDKWGQSRGTPVSHPEGCTGSPGEVVSPGCACTVQMQISLVCSLQHTSLYL